MRIKKQILHIIPYHNLYPPNNGGQLRCFNLMNQLARFHKVDVICYQEAEEIKEKGYISDNVTFFSYEKKVRESGILPNWIQDAISYRWLRRSFDGPAHAVVLNFAPILEDLSKKRQYDMVIFEHLSSMLLAPVVKRYWPKVKTVIDAHNIDYKLISDAKLKFQTQKIESHFYTQVNEFWACSDDDVMELEQMNKKRISGKVVPNGVDIDLNPYQSNKQGLSNNIIFCGSLNYEPNKEGLLWFFDQVWPLIYKACPDVRFTIIGRGNLQPFNHFKDDSRINLVGEVDSVLEYYKENYTAIVPLLSGSGTRLKVLEAMSLGNPIVSTFIGIEGIKAEHNKEGFIADAPEQFAKGVIEMITEPDKGEQLRRNAYELIKTMYDWNTIGDNLKQDIEL